MKRVDRTPPVLAPENGRGQPTEEALGTLVLIGGNASPTGFALKRFIELTELVSGGDIIGITTASADPIASAALWKSDFATAGSRGIDIPIIQSRADACDRDVAKRVADARGIFLGGGDQVKLISALTGTPVGDAIWEAFRRGSVICGTSAGAAALTETTLAGGEIDEEGNLIEMYIGPGLGLLGYGAMIDTHFGERRRLHRLFVAIAGNPRLMGLGLDEDTALCVRGHRGEVVGKGGVTFVDGRSVAFDNANEVTKGRQLTLSHLRVGIVGTGYVFDLRERELEVVLTGTQEPETSGAVGARNSETKVALPGVGLTPQVSP
jgi:cyanophycinase